MIEKDYEDLTIRENQDDIFSGHFKTILCHRTLTVREIK